jgi:predicted O-methyltransferase YrrM
VLSLAQKYFEKAGLSDKIHVLVGDADAYLDDMDETFDLVFMDADKAQYLSYYKKVLPKVRKGGYIIADNVLWSGKVLEENIKNNDYFTKGILAFNAYVQNDASVSNYILPIRDGMMIICKK